ncbi:MAG: VOC family protein, partial [Actinomycetota bacterium]|nr:VOC family protein [Actinomycetota bacterium]
MFGKSEAFSGFAVKDIDAAATFYRDTLGLAVTQDDPMSGLLRLHITGSRDVLVYVKADHVPATYTVLNFPVDDIDAAVDELAGKGVTFE